jgi:hypothetical protein
MDQAAFDIVTHWADHHTISTVTWTSRHICSVAWGKCDKCMWGRVGGGVVDKGITLPLAECNGLAEPVRPSDEAGHVTQDLQWHGRDRRTASQQGAACV